MLSLFFFFFNDTATTEIYTLSLHDALPIWTMDAGTDLSPQLASSKEGVLLVWQGIRKNNLDILYRYYKRSEEHTSELQSQSNLVCRLLLEKKKWITVNFLRSRLLFQLIVTQ